MRKVEKSAGWKVERLGDVCEIDKIPNRKKNLPYVGLEHIESNTGQFIGSTEPLSVKSMTFNFSDKHVLYGRLRPYLKKVLLPNFEGHCSSEIFPLKVSNQLDRRFLFYWLLSDETTEKINATSTGARMPRANMNYVLDFEIPLPPLPEQQRIVSVLDEALTSIAKAKSNAERNLVNAQELFESVLEEVFTNSGHDWEDKKLDDVCSEITVGHVGSMASKYKSSGIPFLRSQNIRPNSIDLNNVVYIDEHFNSQLKKSQLSPGDVVIVRTGYPGTSAVIPKSLPTSNCSDLVIVKPGNLVNPYYLCLFFNSTYGKRLVLGNLVGAAQKHFNVTAAKNVSIPVPPLAEQRAIVARLEALSAETGRLEEIYQSKLEGLEELKKSVLGKAFEGEL